MQQQHNHSAEKGVKAKLSVIIAEGVIFLLFYATMAPLPNSTLIYPAFEILVPVCLGLMFWFNRGVAWTAVKSLGNPDMFVFFFVLLFWIYIFAIKHINVISVFWEPEFVDEINFRLFLIPFLAIFIGTKKAVFVQSVLFALYYFSFLVFFPQAYPGIYYTLFIVDMFSMGILYGVIYMIRKSIYIDMSIHLSLYAMSFVVVSLGWIPYLFLPT